MLQRHLKTTFCDFNAHFDTAVHRAANHWNNTLCSSVHSVHTHRRFE